MTLFEAAFPVLSHTRVCVDFWKMEMISVKDMLWTMQLRTSDGELIPFSIRFVTCNLKAGTGGDIIHLERAVVVGNGKSKGELRNPDHFTNYTRNIRAAEGDKIIKIHALLVIEFNDLKVNQ